MSTRAYRINEIKSNSADSFNINSEDGETIIDFLDLDIREEDSVVEISVKELEDFLGKLNVEISTETRAKLEEDIKFAKEKDKEYIMYLIY
jgi:hypothetical protein